MRATGTPSIPRSRFLRFRAVPHAGASFALTATLAISAGGCAAASGIAGQRPATDAHVADVLGPAIAQPHSAVISADGSRIAFILGDTLYAFDPLDRSRVAVSAGVAGQVTTRHIPFLALSPDGRMLVFRTDSEDSALMLADLNGAPSVRPLLPEPQQARLRTFQHAWADGPSWSPDGERVAFLAAAPEHAARLELYVVHTRHRTLSRWTDDEAQKFGMAWAPDGEWIAVGAGTFGDGSGRVTMIRGDAAGSQQAASVALEGGSDFYHRFRWSPGSDQLLVRRRDNRSVLLQDTSGGWAERPTDLPQRGYVGWTADGAALVSTAAEGMSSRLVLTSLPAGETLPLSGPDTLFTAFASAGNAGNTWILHGAETGGTPFDLRLMSLDGAGRTADPIRVSEVRGRSLDPASEPAVQLVRFRAANGEDPLDAQVLLPPGYHEHDAAVPAVVFAYGGYRNTYPRSEYFVERGIAPLLARGYAVIRPNTRDSRRIADHHYDEAELRDTEALLDRLAGDGIIDADRTAVLGHSHGGAMAFYYLAHSARFCAGIAANGAADWVFQAGLARMAGLPGAMSGTPEEVPDEYDLASPLANADRIRTPLLAMAGARDTQIPPENAERIVAAVTAAGGPAELLRFEDEGHLLEDDRNVRIFWERTLDLLDGNCR
jgi:dipeptidyl aminopeptidase/acylaminoacyl peptidase